MDPQSQQECDGEVSTTDVALADFQSKDRIEETKKRTEGTSRRQEEYRYVLDERFDSAIKSGAIALLDANWIIQRAKNVETYSTEARYTNDCFRFV